MNNIEKTVLNYIRDNDLVSAGDTVVLAVSGGADSISLLHILHNVSSELGIALHVAHLDHMLRGEASTQDAQFVRAMACKLNLPATIGEKEVGAYRKNNHLSLEEAAREVRYRFLEDVVKDTGASSVAVAHTLNDHVETVALHILRGTGLTGLVGLKQKSVLRYERVGPLTIIRPLLCLRRTDVEVYCNDLKLEFRTDATNDSLSFTRNRIRHKLLPTLRADFNPRIDEAFERLSALAADDVDFINAEASKAFITVVRTEGDGLKIDRTGFLSLHPSLKRAVLRRGLASVLGSSKDIEARHIQEMLDLAQGETGRSIDLPDGIKFVSSYQHLTLGRSLPRDIPFPEIQGEYVLNVPGETDISGWRIVATVTEISDKPIQNTAENGFVQSFDLDSAGADLTVRVRKPGDRFRPLGMIAEKSVKNFFIDAKVPQPWRPLVPIIVNPGQVIWVAGYRIDDRVKVTSSSRRVLHLEFIRLGST